MSIIYEALRKTQTMRESVNKIELPKEETFVVPHVKQNRLKFFIIPAIIFIAAVLALGGLFFQKESPIKRREPLVLNGVFLNGKDKYAMINNQSYKLGERIGDLSIISVDLNSVKLQDEDEVVTTLKVIV